MARITENPKVIGLGLLLAVGVALYNNGPALLRKMTAPPPRPVVPPLPPLEVETLRYYRLVPKQFPDRWREDLAMEMKKAIFEEPAKIPQAKRKTEVLPEVPGSWRLTGVWISPDARVGMISGVQVHEGDLLGEFRVAKIERDMVRLSHPKGERVLTLESGLESPPAKRPVPALSASTNLPGGLEEAATQGLQEWKKNQEAVKRLLDAQPGPANR